MYELLCEQRVNPLGIDTPRPRFSWKISSVERGFMQYAYQVLVADSEELLSRDEGNMWNSGKCKSGQSILVPYQGRELESSTRYYWKVRVWDEHNVCCWSRTGSFVTGMLSEKDWGDARWIALEKMMSQRACIRVYMLLWCSPLLVTVWWADTSCLSPAGRCI